MSALDHVLVVALCLLSPLVEWLWLYPRMVRAASQGRTGVRTRGYLVNMAVAWSFTACVFLLWASQGRPWENLRLGIGRPLWSGIGFALAAVYAVLAWMQRQAVLARPDAAELVQRQLGRADALMPRTPGEFRLFCLVALTAGICEEVLYRGFVMWYFTSWTSAIPAVMISSVLFGGAHAYIGIPHVIRSALVGAVFAMLVLGTGSLWPAVVLHAALDLFAGDLTYHALRAARTPA